MPDITPLPDPPTRQDPNNFNDRADEFLSALESPFVPELNALRAEVLGAQTSANAASISAASSQSIASAAATASQFTANALMWSASTAYALGQNAISAVNFQTYRRKVAGTTATDPANDGTNWEAIGGKTFTGISAPSSGWTGSGPYTNVITVTGLLATDSPIVDINLSSVTYADVPDVQSDWGLVYRVAATAANQLTLYATDTPTKNFTLTVKVVR
jgi:hypothetical protein